MVPGYRHECEPTWFPHESTVILLAFCLSRQVTSWLCGSCVPCKSTGKVGNIEVGIVYRLMMFHLLLTSNASKLASPETERKNVAWTVSSLVQRMWYIWLMHFSHELYLFNRKSLVQGSKTCQFFLLGLNLSRKSAAKLFKPTSSNIHRLPQTPLFFHRLHKAPWHQEAHVHRLCGWAIAGRANDLRDEKHWINDLFLPKTSVALVSLACQKFKLIRTKHIILMVVRCHIVITERSV